MASISIVDINNIYVLYVNYAKKGVFTIEEFPVVHDTFMKMKNTLVKFNEAKEAGELPEDSVDTNITVPDMKTVLITLQECAKRTSTQIEEMTPVVELVKKLNAIIEESEKAAQPMEKIEELTEEEALAETNEL